jgi:hypothetical protein
MRVHRDRQIRGHVGCDKNHASPHWVSCRHSPRDLLLVDCSHLRQSETQVLLESFVALSARP